MVKEYGNTDNYLLHALARYAREAKVKSYPVSKDSVRYLIGEYQSFVDATRTTPMPTRPFKPGDALFAYQLDEKDAAIGKLGMLIETPPGGALHQGKGKARTGRYLYAQEEPWESTLLYSQVERSQRETPLI